MRRGIGRLRAGGGGFSPISVFAGSAAGLWLDPSDISTGFTDSAGTTPQTASGQQTGLRLDKRLGLTAGTELITVAADRDFSSDTGFWTKEAGVTIAGGKCSFTAAAAGFGLFKNAFLTGSKYYEVAETLSNFTGGSFSNSLQGNFGATRTTAGTYTERVICSSSAGNTYFIARTINTTLDLDNVSIKEVAGNHFLQSTAGSRSEYDVITGISSDFFDGSDDGYSTGTFAGGTLLNGMDLFCAIKRSSTSNMVLASNGVANASFIGKMIGADGTSSMAGVGTAWTVFVDGVQVGGTNSVTCGQLNTALGSGSYHVLEVRDLDLSAWTQFTLGLYTSFMLGADIGGVILPPAQSTVNRSALRKWLGAKVGLSL